MAISLLVMVVVFRFRYQLPPEFLARLFGRQWFFFGWLVVDLFAVLGAGWLNHCAAPNEKSQREGWLLGLTPAAIGGL